MKEIVRLFPPSFQRFLMNDVSWGKVQEIRLRVNHPLEVLDGASHTSVKGIIVTAEHLAFVLNQISQFSLYRLQDELKEGFLTIEGGHRVGLAGKVNTSGHRIDTLKHITFMNIRVAREVAGQVSYLLPFLYADGRWKSTMIIGPPHSGKTTLLRALSKWIGSDHTGYRGCKVAVVDERSEIAASLRGVPQLEVGVRTDVMDGCPKAAGMMMMIRSMSPDVLIVDEIGGLEDADAVREASYTGVQVICSIHGRTLDGVRKRPSARSLVEEQVFERYVVLERMSPERNGGVVILDESGKKLAGWKGWDDRAVDRSRHYSDCHHVDRV
ncbi:stage III sporulation protein AA [Halobacillus sp. KGW1]|uniref:stage III sporulation protein AA n=1 Tax=Halobacillus sp. KGW1 TaxID=1793726 RepID=UPI000780A0E6|nr:stage III sporulation protein AA [Halobacillus sp. KGW1]